MTDEPKTSEQPSGHLRWVQRSDLAGDIILGRRVLQQLWYITRYEHLGDEFLHGVNVEQVEEWRDVPLVSE